MNAGGRVVFCGAWDDGPGYPRTAGLRQGLERAGVAVVECRAPAQRDKQRLLRSPWRWPAAWWRARAARRRLQADLRRELAGAPARCVVVPYPGHHLVRGIRAACRVPIVLDLFLSAYDTMVEDRRLCEPGSLGAAFLQRVDTAACAAADLVLCDTPSNAAYMAELTGLPPERFAWLPLSDPSAGRPTPPPPPSRPELHVLFFGTGVPLHGLDVLIDAVAAAGPNVQLTLVGGSAGDRKRAQAVLGARVRIEAEFLDRERLGAWIAASDVVAGVFGRSGKAQRVVPWKVVIALAAGRPVVTADTPAVAAWLDGSGAVFGVPAGDVKALAAMLRELQADRARVAAAAEAARVAYDRHFGLERAAARWRELLARVEAAP